MATAANTSMRNGAENYHTSDSDDESFVVLGRSLPYDSILEVKKDDCIDALSTDIVQSSINSAKEAMNELSKSEMSRNDLSKNDLSRIDLSRIDLSRSDLSRNDLSSNDLTRNELSNNELSKSDMSKSEASEKLPSLPNQFKLSDLPGRSLMCAADTTINGTNGTNSNVSSLSQDEIQQKVESLIEENSRLKGRSMTRSFLTGVFLVLTFLTGSFIAQI